MGLRLKARSRLTLPSGPARRRAVWARDEEEPLRFDRRREPRAATSGWARLICLDPYKSFLGGTVELADVSNTGLGLRSPRAIPIGDFVEVRLAPFRVRGRIARVVRCDEVPAVFDEATGRTLAPRHYRIGVQHSQALRAA